MAAPFGKCLGQNLPSTEVGCKCRGGERAGPTKKGHPKGMAFHFYSLPRKLPLPLQSAHALVGGADLLPQVIKRRFHLAVAELLGRGFAALVWAFYDLLVSLEVLEIIFLLAR